VTADVSDIQDSAAATATNLSEFRALARLLRCGIVLLDHQAHLRFASPGACRLLGMDTERALRRQWKGLYPTLKLDALHSLAPGADPLRTRLDLERRESVRQLRLEAHAVNHRDGVHYLLLLKERGRIDATDLPILLASQARVQEHVLGSLLHDINGPLNNFTLTLTLLEATLGRVAPGTLPSDLDARVHRYIDVLKGEAKRLAYCARELSAVSMPLQSSPGRVDFAGLFRDVQRVLRHEATAREIGLDVHVPAHPVWGVGEPGMLRLAALDFLICLMDVTAPAGRISIVVDPEPRESRAIVRITAENAQLPDEVMKEFYRLMFVPDSDYIGLVAGRLIIEQQGGEAVLRADAGEPLGVELRLPASSS